MVFFRHIAEAEVSCLVQGTILWLPPKDQLPAGAYVDPLLLGNNEGACNHPVVIVSCPPSKEIKTSSHVEVAIITSFHGTMIKSHLAQKGKKFRTGTLAAEKAGYLRIVTSSKPFAKDVLKLKNGKGMNKDSAYVNVKKTYGIAVSALAKYGLKGEDVGAYRLTPHAIKALVESVTQYRERRKVENGTGKEEEEKGHKTGIPIKSAAKTNMPVT